MASLIMSNNASVNLDRGEGGGSSTVTQGERKERPLLTFEFVRIFLPQNDLE